MVRLATPAVAQELFVSAIFLVDAFIVSSLGPEALGAVGTAGVVLWRMRSVIGAIQAGAGALVARRWGAREYGSASLLFGHSMVLGLLLGMISLVLFAFRVPIFTKLISEEAAETAALAALYFAPMSLVYPLRIASQNMAACLRAAGNTSIHMYLTFAVNILNILIAYPLVFGMWGLPRLGVLGAGIASAIAFAFEFVVLLILGFRGVELPALVSMKSVPTGSEEPEGMLDTEALPASRLSGQFRISREGVKPWLAADSWSILKISHGAFWEEVLISIGFLGFIWMIGEMGANALAAHVAVTRLESFSYGAGYGVAVAASTLVGQSLGAGNIALARRTFAVCLTFSTFIMGAIASIYCAWPTEMLGLFATKDASFLPLATMLFIIIAIEQPLIGATLVLGAGLRGAGDTVTPLIAQLAGTIGVRLGLGYHLAITLDWGVEGIYWATVVDWGTRSLVLGAIVLRGKWETLKFK